MNRFSRRVGVVLALLSTLSTVRSAESGWTDHHVGHFLLALPTDWWPMPDPERQSDGGFYKGNLQKQQGMMVGVMRLRPSENQSNIVAMVTREAGTKLVESKVRIGDEEANLFKAVNSGEKGTAHLWLAFPARIPADGIPRAFMLGGSAPAWDEPLAEKILAGIRWTEPPYTLMRKVGSEGNAPGQLQYPEALDLDADGRLLVADAHNYRVSIFAPDGAFVTAWGKRGHEKADMGSADSLTTDRRGSVFLGFGLDRKLKKFSADGLFQDAWGDYKNADGRGGVNDLACGPDGRVYMLCNIDTQQYVSVMSPDGTLGGKWPAKGHKLAVGPSGRVYVLERLPGFVRSYDSNGEPGPSWNFYGVTDIPAPTNAETCVESIATGPDGAVYLGDNDGRIVKYNADGRFLMSWGPAVIPHPAAAAVLAANPARPNIGHPADIAVAANGDVYVVDRYQDAILHFAAGPSHRVAATAAPAAPATPVEPPAAVATPPVAPSEPAAPAPSAADLSRMQGEFWRIVASARAKKAAPEELENGIRIGTDLLKAKPDDAAVKKGLDILKAAP